MKKIGLVSLSVALMVVGISVFSTVAAQDSAPKDVKDSPLYFSNIDKNNDDSIGRSEVPKELGELRSHFDQYDVNRDHRLSKAEYVAYLGTLSQGACRENEHTSSKCASSPYSMSTPTMGVSSMNAPKVQPQKGN